MIERHLETDHLRRIGSEIVAVVEEQVVDHGVSLLLGDERKEMLVFAGGQLVTKPVDIQFLLVEGSPGNFARHRDHAHDQSDDASPRDQPYGVFLDWLIIIPECCNGTAPITSYFLTFCNTK